MAVGSKVVGIATGLVVRKVADKAVTALWRKTRRSEPPADPASLGTPWGEALSWAVASGAAVGVARMVATRGTASAKARITGTVPEGLEPPRP